MDICSFEVMLNHKFISKYRCQLRNFLKVAGIFQSNSVDIFHPNSSLRANLCFWACREGNHPKPHLQSARISVIIEWSLPWSQLDGYKEGKRTLTYPSRREIDKCSSIRNIGNNFGDFSGGWSGLEIYQISELIGWIALCSKSENIDT